ncbi:MAG: DUF7009 family protein [Janthinobacterium lividum]
MKLRIKGNSVRLRVTRSEVSQLLTEGRIEEVVYFTADGQSRLTYALERSDAVSGTQLLTRPQEVAIVLPAKAAASWAEGTEVGVYATVDLGLRGSLELMVEKDFACLDLSDAENVDTFPNPNAGASC